MIEQVTLLKALAWRKRPVTVDVLERKDGLAVKVNGETIPVKTHRETTAGKLAKELEEALRWYPDEVTLGGNRMERSPWNGLATLSVKEYLDPYGQSYKSRPLAPGHAPGHPHPADSNTAVAGGLAIRLSPDNKNEQIYFSLPPDQRHPHWALLTEVKVRPVLVIHTAELEDMDQEELELALTRAVDGTEEVLALRLQEQIQRTQAHPASPKPWTGRTRRHWENPGPPSRTATRIAVLKGEPLIIPAGPEGTPPRPAAAAAAALYRTNTGLVPVSGWRRDGNELEATRITFEIEGAEESDQDLKPARRIRLTVSTKQKTGEARTELEAQMVLHESDNGQPAGHYVPGEVTSDEIEAILKAAYRHNSPEDGDAAVERRLRTMAVAAAEGHEEALRQNLKAHADSFNPGIPMPGNAVTARSEDGTVTITARRTGSVTAPCACGGGPVTHRFTAENEENEEQTLSCAQCLIDEMWNARPLGRDLEEIK